VKFALVLGDHYVFELMPPVADHVDAAQPQLSHRRLLEPHAARRLLYLAQ
jgi:hypothetical protein